MKKQNVILLCVMSVLLTACLTFFITLMVCVPLFRAETPAARKIAAIEGYVQNYFIDDYDPEALADAAANAMIEATGDRWSFYIPADEYDSYHDLVDNAYTGIGVTIYQDPTENGFTIASVNAGGPAENADIRVGDILTHVEGESVLSLGFDETRSRIRGKIGTWITLTFLREESSFDVKIQRTRIDTAVAEDEILDSGLGYVRIDNFDRNAAQQSIRCIEELVKQNVPGLIVDVRTNPGGLRSELVELLDYLMPYGPVFRSMDYTGEEITEYSDANSIDLPMVVLVDKHTYSAAEFFAAALQECGKAIVVGEKTSGKGNYQVAFDLPDGSAVNLSVGKYFTPMGRSLTDVGVTPDKIIPVPEGEDAKIAYDEQLKAAEAILLP